MRNIGRVLGAILLAAPLLAGGQEAASAQSAPDFSGTWLLNQQKSEMPQPRRPGGGRPERPGGGPGRPSGLAAEKMTIVQQGDELRVQTEDPGGGTETVFNLGAGPQEVSTPRGPATVDAKWETGVLVVERVQEFETPRGNMKIEQLQRWALSEDGNTLTQETVSQTPRGERRSKLVYERVKE